MKLAAHPRLVFGSEERAAVRAMAATAEGEAIVRRLKALLEEEADGITVGSHAAGWALRYVLEEDKGHAAQARQWVEKAMAGVAFGDSPPLWKSDYKMIFRTKAAVDVALAYDLCGEAWDAAFRRQVAGELDRLAREFTRGGGKGFNNKPTSNWVGNTKAAGGFLALAVAGDEGAGEDLPAVAATAKAGFFEYLQNAYGDAGWCAEGFNYMRYPLTTSGFQFLQALTRAEGRDVVSGTPAEHIMPMYVTQMVAGKGGVYVPFFGLSYPFRGREVTGFEMMYERTRWRSGDLVMGMGSAPERVRPAVRWMVERAFGEQGDGSYDVGKPADAIYALANLACVAEARNPGEVLPRARADKELGYFVMRKGWRDGGDAVAAISANARPRPGTYSFQDAGSFRLYAYGTRWADQGSRKDRKWEVGISRALENVVQIAGTNGWGAGKVLSAVVEADGSAAVAMDIAGAYGKGEALSDWKAGEVTARRAFAVDYSEASGHGVLAAVVDDLAGPGEKRWVMHTAGQAEATERGFRITGSDGATLEATVIAPAKAQVAIVEGQETHAVTILGGDGFFVVMTIQPRGGHAVPRVEGVGLGAEVRVGGRRVRYIGGVLEMGKAGH